MSENHEGNLGLISGKSSRFKLWVLEDVEKQEWSERVYVLPAEWKNIVGEQYVLKFVGLSRTNEIVLSSWYSVKPFFLFYFSPERNTVVRVEIEGVDMDGSKFAVLQPFLDHVEDVKLYGKVH
ncbi:F-box protein At5g65850 [Brassica rapa]|nr:F-box protein At5g65850 [Brassica rapa]